MRIATIGKGNVGGGLADRWERAGHEVTRVGSKGGDVSEAELVLVAVPGGAVAEMFEAVQGLAGKTVIDATNLVGAEPAGGFSSNAEFIKSRTQGPTAKSFNINFARLYDELDALDSRPSNVWCGDDEAREAVEKAIRDAGYDPVYAGPLENAGDQERLINLIFAINQGGMGPFFYRIAPPDQL
jgi:8-hydroxy-5-deazaflavin:NADPH oxidoreductase